MLLNMLKKGCFAHLKEKMIMRCLLDQYLENILLEDLKHAKGLWMTLIQSMRLRVKGRVSTVL